MENYENTVKWNAIIAQFLDWHNEKYPDRSIPNSEIGLFSLTQRDRRKNKRLQQIIKSKDND